MMNAKHGVGGAARRLATGGVGSSPAVSIQETRIKVLRRMLRTRDRWLQPWQDIWKRRSFPESNQRQFEQWDLERQAIRERIKAVARLCNRCRTCTHSDGQWCHQCEVGGPWPCGGVT